MLKLPQTVDKKWTGANRKYFELKGYTFTGYNISFKVNVLDLQPSSDIRVIAICSICNKPKRVQYKSIKKQLDREIPYICGDCKGIRISSVKQQYYLEENTSVDIDFFKKDSPELAYLAGIIATDGTVSKEDYRVEVTMSARDVIEWIHEVTKCKNPIHEYDYKQKKDSYKTQWRVAFSNKIVRQILEERYCIVPNKSLIIKFPILAKELLPHFIRGVFDGFRASNPFLR